jgi:hypothetical protein
MRKLAPFYIDLNSTKPTKYKISPQAPIFKENLLNFQVFYGKAVVVNSWVNAGAPVTQGGGRKISGKNLVVVEGKRWSADGGCRSSDYCW